LRLFQNLYRYVRKKFLPLPDIKLNTSILHKTFSIHTTETHEELTLTQYAIPRNLQNCEDPHTNPASNVLKSSNLLRTTHKPDTLFYKIFKTMMFYTQTLHVILQNLQTYEDKYKSPASLFYKIFKPMMIYTQTQQTILRNQLHYIVEF
jgi:hypothetical protein